MLSGNRGVMNFASVSRSHSLVGAEFFHLLLVELGKLFSVGEDVAEFLRFDSIHDILTDLSISRFGGTEVFVSQA